MTLRRLIGLAIILFISISLPQSVNAHAALVKATPAPNSHLTTAPKAVTLLFNERISDDLYKLEVYDSNGNPVTSANAGLGKKHRQLRLDLPKLQNGLYTVSYKIVSADGHPVAASYTFTVGKPVTVDREEPLLSAKNEPDHSHGNLAADLVRILEYLALLLTTGWVFWGAVFRSNDPAVQERYTAVLKFLKSVFLFLLTGWTFVKLSELIGELGTAKTPAVLTSTVGTSLVGSLILALVSFWIVGRSRWLDFVWIALLLFAEARNGHAAAFSPVPLSILSDVVHLFAASIWTGGLLYVFYFWKTDKAHAKRFLPKFSNTAFACLLILIVSGTLSTWIYLPSLNEIFYTAWGKWLLAKCLVILGVILTGFLIRKAMRNHDEEAVGRRVKTDFVLMLLIIVIVGIFTSLNPVPNNEPLTWHTSGKELAATTYITPKQPGTGNQVIVKIDTPTKPNHVSIELDYLDKNDFAPIHIELHQVGKKNGNFVFENEQISIPFTGKWQIKLKLLDAKDNETVWKKSFRVYKQ
ncbi:MAG TPA: copper resistance protein CopC [Bacillales bacterium]|nr:copper resistance protein CopC [Bacillales bacterium]